MNRIKELRVAKGLTQEELSTVLNVQRSALSKYENGAIPLTDNTVTLLADYFGVTTDYLLGRTHVQDSTESNSPDVGKNDELTDYEREIRAKKDALIAKVLEMDELTLNVIDAAADAIISRRDKE